MKTPYQFFAKIGNVCTCLCTVYHNGKALVMIVDDVYCHPEFRGKGFGTRLMEKVLRVAKLLGVDSVELVVNTDNETAINLYERVGFQKTNKYHLRRILNERPDHYNVDPEFTPPEMG